MKQKKKIQIKRFYNLFIIFFFSGMIFDDLITGVFFVVEEADRRSTSMRDFLGEEEAVEKAGELLSTFPSTSMSVVAECLVAEV